MRRLPSFALPLLVVAGWPAPAAAQDPAVFESCRESRLFHRGVDRDAAGRTTFTGPVEIHCDQTSVFADLVELDDATDLVIATGHVLLVQPGLRISADRAELNRRTRYGTFHVAAGYARLTERAIEKSLFGTLEPDVHFWGQRIERVGPRRYRLTEGGFTTCAQPTARWEVGGSTGTVTLDERVVLRHAVLRVKGVPLLYAPVLWYPIGEDDRSTGFLLPTYGTSTVRGTGLSNAFFWAMSRSQDTTFYYDWFSKSGQGLGTEYRYAAAAGSEGQARFYLLDERARKAADGTTTERAAHRSYDVRGTVNQSLPGGFRLIGRANYFTDVTTKQLYDQNVFDFSQRERYFGATLAGGVGRYRLTANVEQRDFYFGLTSAQRQGRAPSVQVSMGSKPLGRSRVYFAAGGEAVYLIRQDDLDRPETNHSLWRFDASPIVRFPVSALSFLTVTTSARWRITHWLESVDPATFAQVPTPVTRQLVDLGATVIGPVLARVWQTPASGYAERFKHLIEPAVSISWLSPFDQFDRVVKIDGLDYAVGGTTTVTYGLTNRLLARRRGSEGSGLVRDVLSVRISQTYYSNALAGAFDAQYQSATAAATSFSPVRISVDAAPTDRVSARFNTEIDARFGTPRQYNASGTATSSRLSVSAGWSKRQVIAGLPGYDDPRFASHFLNASATLRTPDNRFGSTYGFNLDLLNRAWLQQRVLAYYNAQCCGISLDYQSVSFARFGLSSLPVDRRLSLSFTLAGIGSFANPFGAFGDNSGRR